MNSSDSINREALIKTINLVRPALASQDYIPALKHILLDNGYASAFNDVAAIKVQLPNRDMNLGLCLPGEMLSKTLASFNAESVLLQEGKDATLLVSSGRSKIKMPTLPAKSFPLTLPSDKAPSLPITTDILLGIQLCLISVGNDPTHPATMGVTIDAEDGKAVLFSTDNATISRYQSKSKIKLPGDAPVILPTFFCEQLFALSKAFPKAEIEVELHVGALIAYFINPDEAEVAVLFQKTLVDTEPLDFPKIVAKHVIVKDLGNELTDIPVAFDAAFQRALLVLGSVVDKATKITVTDDAIKMLSTSDAGEAADAIAFDGPKGGLPEPFFVDPGLISRASKACSAVAFRSRIVVMTDKWPDFIHLVSHCSGS